MRAVASIQEHLKREQIDGWLLYDYKGSNDLAWQFLGIPADLHATRRFLLWIPAQGTPVKIVSVVEADLWDFLPGEKKSYLSWQTLETHLKEQLRGVRRVAMEYSPRSSIPAVSKVDGGMLELVRSFGVEVVSSAPLLLPFICTWSEEQLKSHLEAAAFLDALAARAWEKIAAALKRGDDLTEYAVQQWLLEEMASHGFITAGEPICAINAHAASPHYAPSKRASSLIRKGDFILLDLWCKRKEPNAVFADITRVAVAAAAPSAKQKNIFDLVRSAQREAVALVKKRITEKKPLRGYEVDQACRQVIEKAGYGEFFTHRTGHNIHIACHGPGTHFDSLETWDDRPVIAKSCYSVEPGIYLPGEFGVRLEHDLYIGEHGEVLVTGGVQDAIVIMP